MASVATREPAAADRRGRRRRPLAVLVLGAVAVAGGWLAAPAAAALDDYPPALSAAPLDSAVDQWGFFNRECTSFVAWRMAQAGVSRAEVGFADSWGPAPGGLDHWGDATGWDAYAAALGYRVDATAAVGAIAQWHGGERGGGLVASAEGHVAYVAGVAPDGSATIEDYNGAGGAGAYGTLSGVRAPRYLHVADAVTTLDTQAGGSPPGGSAASHAATVGSGSTGGASASVTSAGRTGAGPASPRPGRRLSFAAARALRPALVRLPVMLDQLRALDAAAHPGG